MACTYIPPPLARLLRRKINEVSNDPFILDYFTAPKVYAVSSHSAPLFTYPSRSITICRYYRQITRRILYIHPNLFPETHSDLLLIGLSGYVLKRLDKSPYSNGDPESIGFPPRRKSNTSFFELV